MYYTLSQLRDAINRKIVEQGEDAPVAAFVFTKNDVFYHNIGEDGFPDLNNEEYLSDEDSDEVLTKLGGCDYIYRFAYGSGLLLSELLMAESGFNKMMDFWRSFSVDKDWRLSFKDIYGIEIDIWYKTKGVPYLMQDYARVKRY